MVSPDGSECVLDELEKEIHTINSLAHIIRSVRCQVDLSNILDCHAYDASVSMTCKYSLFCVILLRCFG